MRMSRSVSLALSSLALSGLLLAGACSPRTSTVEGGSPDLATQARDMSMCQIDPSNQLQNPGFETPSVELDGNGKASNTGSPASSIPGRWDGCCNQAGGGTTWTVTTTMARCGFRSLLVSSTSANANVLNQTLPLSALVGKTLYSGAYVYVSQAGSGAKLGLDIWDLNANKVIASSPTISTTTPDWQRLDLSVQIERRQPQAAHQLQRHVDRDGRRPEHPGALAGLPERSRVCAVLFDHRGK